MKVHSGCSQLRCTLEMQRGGTQWRGTAEMLSGSA